MKSFFIVKPNKIFYRNGAIKLASYTTQQLPGANVGGWGDPHLYVRQPQSLNPNDYSIGKFLAKVGDNKGGSSGLSELQLLNLYTLKNKIQIYYTNKNYGTAKVVTSVRVVLDGVSKTYTDSAYVKAGPITLSIAKFGTGANSYLNFELQWSTIPNVIKFSGALSAIMKKIASSNGYWNGLDGATWDGIGYAGQGLGLTRGSFETANLQNQSVDNLSIQSDIEFSDEEFAILDTLSLDESSITHNLNDNNTNQTADVWDPTILGDSQNGIVSSLDAIQQYGTIEHQLANQVKNGYTIEGMDSGTADTVIDNFIQKEVNSSYSYTQSIKLNLSDNFIP